MIPKEDFTMPTDSLEVVVVIMEMDIEVDWEARKLDMDIGEEMDTCLTYFTYLTYLTSPTSPTSLTSLTL